MTSASSHWVTLEHTGRKTYREGKVRDPGQDHTAI